MSVKLVEIKDSKMTCPDSCWGIAESKGYDQHLEESEADPEGHLPFIALGNAYQVVS